MLCFTVISRAADQMSVAAVVTARPENKMITHDIAVAGKVTQNQELAVTTEPDQRVKSIYVSEGDRVKKGDLLFEIDLTLLEEKILAQQQEMEKQQLTVGDAKSQKEVSVQQKASQQAQAAEQYALSTHSAGVQLSRAREALDEAKKELKRFRKKHQNESAGQDSSVEASLEQACEEKAQAYIQAQQELAQVQWKIENAVHTALQQAVNNASRMGGYAAPALEDTDPAPDAPVLLEEPDEVRTGSSDGAGELDAPEELLIEDFAGDRELSENGAWDDAQASVGHSGTESYTQEEGPEAAPDWASAENEPGAGDITIEGAEIVGGGEATDAEADGSIGGNGSTETGGSIGENGSTGTDGNIGGNGSTGTDGSIGGNGSTGTDGSIGGNGSTGTGGSVGENGDTDADGAGDIIIEGMDEGGADAPSQEELDRIEQSVRDSYASELLAAQQKVETALAQKQEAEKALAQYQQERLEAGNAQNAQSEKQLIANVKAAQQAYEDAAIAANEAAVTSGRAVQQAGIPDASNSSDRMNEITYEQMELQLSKLEKLKQEEGRITAPCDGLITKIQVITGEKTTDTTAMLLTDLSKGYRFKGELTKEQEEYIAVGDSVTLRGSSKKQVLEELPVESVTEDESQEDIYQITVQIPMESDVFELGAGATLEFSKKSEAYPVCVPLSALRLDEKNQTYVLVTEQYDSVLGTEIRARRVDVTVLEKNESYAALAQGGLTSQQEVIISSNKAVDEGSRVRVQE